MEERENSWTRTRSTRTRPGIPPHSERSFRSAQLQPRSWIPLYLLPPPPPPPPPSPACSVLCGLGVDLRFNFNTGILRPSASPSAVHARATMSFNSRFPPEHNRRRHNGNGPRFTQTAAAKAEDAQPNELLSKRNVAGPPVIRTSVPIPRNCGRGTYTGRGPLASFRGRGGLHTAAPTPRTDRSTGGFYSQAGNAIPGSSARPSTQVGGRNVQANASTHAIPTPRPPNALSQKHGFSDCSRATVGVTACHSNVVSLGSNLTLPCSTARSARMMRTRPRLRTGPFL